MMTGEEETEAQLTAVYDQARAASDAHLDRLLASVRGNTAGITAPRTAITVSMALALFPAETRDELLITAVLRLLDRENGPERADTAATDGRPSLADARFGCGSRDTSGTWRFADNDAGITPAGLVGRIVTLTTRHGSVFKAAEVTAFDGHSGALTLAGETPPAGRPRRAYRRAGQPHRPVIVRVYDISSGWTHCGSQS